MTLNPILPPLAGTVPACLDSVSPKPRCLAALVLATAIAPLMLGPATALAQDETPDVDSVAAATTDAERDVYPSAYFDLYVPRTALDMIARIPGFSIRTGDTSRRGLGQGGANILINGERLAGKTDPFDQLDQILASSVVEIRIREGATLSIPGLSGQVADVIVEKDARLKGTWEWQPEFREGRQPNWLNSEVNLNGELEVAGGISYAVTLRDFGFKGGAIGTEELRGADGVLFETRREIITNEGAQPGVALNLGWTPAEGHRANLNASYFEFNFNRTAPAVRTPLSANGSDLQTAADRSEDEWNIEVDADYEFPLLDGKFKLTGVLDRESSPTTRSFARTSPAAGFLGASRFDQVAEELELVGRAEYGWSPSEGRDWQIAGEVAYNELDIEQQLFLLDPPFPVSGADFVGQGLTAFVVSEDRAEATLTHSRKLGEDWDVQVSAGMEYSSLMQETAGALSAEPREFVRPKGFVSANYKASDTLDIRLRAEREVGQLNFFDFVASVDLEDNLGRSSNPDLVPDQSWLGSVEFDKDFGEGNTVRVEVYGALIEDTVDRIPVGLTGDAVGNIGTALRYGVDVASTLKGDRWGLPGTELNIELEWRDSSVDDPLLGFSRRLNGDKEIFYEVEYRHDIPGTDWAYGGFFSRFISSERFRLLSIDRNGVDKPFARAFVEHKDVMGMTVQVSLGNLFNQVEFFERTRFDARRDVGAIKQFERIDFDFGPILRFNISGDF